MTTSRFLFTAAFAFLYMGGGASAPALAAAKRAPTVITTDLAGIKRALAEARAKPGTRAVVMNVWATWCEPCKEEMPDLLRFARDPKAKGVRLVLVSADPTSKRADVAKYLGTLGVDFPSYLKTGDDMAFIDGLDPGWDGTLPTSWLYDATGKQAHRWRGKVTYQELIDKIATLQPPRRNP